MKADKRLVLRISLADIYEDVVLLFCYVFIAYMMWGAVGGVDLATYEDSSQVPLHMWGWYYYKEFVSWAVIKLSYEASALVGVPQPAILLTLILFLVMRLLTFGTGLSVKYLPLVLLAPLSVLLAFNILRQYMAIFLLFLSILMILKGRGALFLFLSIFAVFSHNSIVLLLLVVCFVYWLSIRSALFMILAVQVVIFLLDRAFDLGAYELGIYNDNDSASPLIRLLFHFSYVVLLSFAFALYIRIVRHEDRYFFNKLNAGLLFFSALVVVFPWPFWVANRFLIYVAFVYLALILVRYDVRCVNRVKYNMLIAVLVSFNVAAIFMHAGALQMLASISSAN